MSDAEHKAMKILKFWVLDLRLGNDPTPETWAEIREANARLPEAEREAMRALLLDLLNELDHRKNCEVKG
jgi:hypothetical protein